MNGAGQAGAAGEVLATAEALKDVLDKLSARLDKMTAYGQRSRRVIWTVAVSVSLDIALSAGVFLLVLGLGHANMQIRQAQLTACAVGNQFRAGQLRLWDHVIAISAPPPHETEAQRAARLRQLAAFRAYIGAQFRPVDCARLYAHGLGGR